MTKQVTLIAALFATAACQQQAVPPANQAQDSNILVSDMPEGDGPKPPVDRPPAAPPPPASQAAAIDPKSPAAAVQVVNAYFAALAERQYDAANRLFPANGMNEADFAASYAKYRTLTAMVGKPGDTEGGAGSIYIEIPVVVTGMLSSGAPYRLEGPVALRRVNDVDGATAAQLRWHIISSGLKPRP